MRVINLLFYVVPLVLAFGCKETEVVNPTANADGAIAIEKIYEFRGRDYVVTEFYKNDTYLRTAEDKDFSALNEIMDKYNEAILFVDVDDPSKTIVFETDAERDAYIKEHYPTAGLNPERTNGPLFELNLYGGTQYGGQAINFSYPYKPPIMEIFEMGQPYLPFHANDWLSSFKVRSVGPITVDLYEHGFFTGKRIEFFSHVGIIEKSSLSKERFSWRKSWNNKTTSMVVNPWAR